MSHSVLIAEGDATELELIATVLARDGFHVVRARDGATAAALFGAEHVELVICDAELPGMDGAAVCELVKRVKPETRFVLLHAAGNDIDASAILLSRIGCDAVLPSPFRYDALKNVLADWGFRAQPKVAAIPMSFAVPAPDITELVAAPSVESLVPEAAIPALDVVAPIAVDAPIAVPIPIPVVFPTVVETPVLAEYAGTPAEEKPAAVSDDVAQLVRDFAMDDADAPAAPEVEPTPALPDQAKQSPEAAVIAKWVGGTEAEPGVVAEVERAVAEWTLRESAFEMTEEEPQTEQPATEQPATEQPTTEQSTTEQSTTEQSTTEQPQTEQPQTEQPQTEDPTSAFPPAFDGPADVSLDLASAFPQPADFNAEAALRMLELPEEPPATAPLIELPPRPDSEPRAAPELDAQPQPSDAAQAAAADSDWLIKPPPSEAPKEGFASLDFPHDGLDSVLDAALGDIPTARPAAEPAIADMQIVTPPEPEPAPPAEPDPAAVSIELAPAPALTITLPVPGAEVAKEDTEAAVDLGLTRVAKSEPAPQPLQPTKVNFGTIPGPDAKIPAKPRQLPPPPPAESVVDPNRLGSGVRAGASSWAPGSMSASSDAAPRIEARGLIAPPPAPPTDDTAAAPPPPSDVLADTPPPPPADMSVQVTTHDPVDEPAPPPPPSEALHEPPPAPLATVGSRPFAPTHEPRTTLPPSVPPEGDLRSLPLPRLLFELYGGTYCGTLRLMRKGIERVIDIWNGFPVGASVKPANDDDSLAALLRDHGRITAEQFDDAKRRAPGREAQLLVALGVIDERDLLDVMREQTELRVAASFEWRDGHYKITPTKDPPESALSEIHPIKAIWRGCSEHYDVGSLLTFFSTLRARYIVATEVFPIHYPTLGPFLRRVGIADILNGHTTFEQALRSDDTQALAIAQALYVLIVTDMVRAQSTSGAPAILPESKPQRRQTRPIDYRELSKACEEVARAYLGIRERDYFEVLEVSRDATDVEINTAYERLSKPFKVESLLPGLPDDVIRRAREIDGLLRRARDTLVSPEERRRYLNRIDVEPPPPPADALAS